MFFLKMIWNWLRNNEQQELLPEQDTRLAQTGASARVCLDLKETVIHLNNIELSLAYLAIQ